MRYRLTARASDDLLELVLYGIETFGETQARKYHQSLEHIFGLLADMPLLGRAVADFRGEIRRFEHGRHSIYYRVEMDHVLIVRLVDNRRNVQDSDLG